MNRTTKTTSLPALTVDLLQAGNLLINNLFADLWRQVGMKTLLVRAGFSKRSGLPMPEVVYALLLWVWLQKESIGMFARDAVQNNVGKDVLYDTINREDLDWRKLHELIAYKAVRELAAAGKKALVADDSIVRRFGKKMPGVSSHFDHTSGRCVMGQQVLTLGLSCEQGFVPLDKELFISQKKAQPLHEPFQDGRSIVAKRYRVADQQTKPDMLKAMIHRALRAGIEADYLLADAWFGTKPMLKLSQEASLVPVFRMKKNNMKYRLTHYQGGEHVKQDLDSKALYKHSVRKAWRKIPGQAFQAQVVDAELNLAASDKEPEDWVKVRLLFVRGMANGEKATVGKHDWALFLTTDTALSEANMLELYAMRWAIEIYQPCCLRKSVYKELIIFVHGLMYPDTLSAPLLA